MVHQLILNYQKTKLHKVGKSGGLLKTGLSLIGNVLKTLAITKHQQQMQLFIRKCLDLVLQQ